MENCALQYTVFVYTLWELLTELTFKQPGHRRLLCMVCEQLSVLKCRLQVRLGYAFFLPRHSFTPKMKTQFLHNFALAECLFYVEKMHKKGFCA